jgi:predicted component of type VI protein secretion system
MIFTQGNLLNIGRDLMIEAFEQNNIILYHPSVALRQVVIRRDEAESYFIRPLKNETILKDSVLVHGREEKLSDGDLVKIGVFTFRVKFAEGEPRLEIIEYRG